MRLMRAGAAMLGAFALLVSTRAIPAANQADMQPPARVPSQEPVTTPPRVEDEILRYMAASRPGPGHRWLEPLVGSWKMDAAWASPDQKPLHMIGTCENRWILGGRFLLSELVGGGNAVRIEGMTLYGFDNQKMQFFAIGLNNLGTSVTQAWGSYDPVVRSYILSGKDRDEVAGTVFVYRDLLKIETPDRHVLQVFFDVPGRPPLKVVEATFTRR